MTYGALEDHRAIAIVSASLVEECLARFLRSRLRDCAKLFETNGPLATHSARYRVAYAMNLIDARAKSDMEGIAKIRNKFAHLIDDDLTFGHERFAKIFESFHCEKREENQSLKDFYRRVCETTAIYLWADALVQQREPAGRSQRRTASGPIEHGSATMAAERVSPCERAEASATTEAVAAQVPVGQAQTALSPGDRHLGGDRPAADPAAAEVGNAA